MPAANYVKRVEEFSCTQWSKNLPPPQWPPGVDNCDLGDGSPHFHYSPLTIGALTDTDWVVINETGLGSVLDDKTFQATYTKA